MIITQYDYVFVIFYLIGMILLLSIVKKRTLKGSPIAPYFLPAFILKAIAAIAVGMIYQYAYGFGDTFGYYNMGKFFLQVYREENADFYELFFSGDYDLYSRLAYIYNFNSWYAFNPATIVVARFSAFFSLLGGGYYLTTSLFFALLSFGGVWQLYRTFYRMYPFLYKPLAYFVLFLPSVLLWGSALLKDSLAMGGVGFLTYGCYALFIKRKSILTPVLLIVFSSLLLAVIKGYILVGFVPAILIWIIANVRRQMRNKVFRKLLIPVVLVTLVLAFGFLSNQYSSAFDQLSIEKIANTAITQQQNIQTLQAGSSYNISISDKTFRGFLSAVFPAIIVTFFRPFLWEINNLFSAMASLESLFFLGYTFFVLRKVGPGRFLKIFLTNATVLFCMTYSIIFAIAVGISSGNFGTLVRYKIPCLPFYLIGLLLIYSYGQVKNLEIQKKENS